MSSLYITENNAKLSIENNYYTVSFSDGMKKLIPSATLENVQLFGNTQITTQCMKKCLTDGVSVSYYSNSGKYYGKISSTGNINVERQRKQCSLYETDFSLNFAKLVISAKINNQIIIAERYKRNSTENISEELKTMRICKGKIENASKISVIMGYEGFAARQYFKCLSKFAEKEFAFKGRSKRPPRDEFNSMLSLGYSLLMNEIYGKIEAKGLNPYFGFIHSDRENHPTLASDMMEEWRAVIVDSMVMSLVNRHEILKEHFIHEENFPGVYLTKEGMKIFIKKYDNKINTSMRYLDYLDYEVSFRRAMDKQISSLVRAMEAEDAGLYHPLKIR